MGPTSELGPIDPQLVINRRRVSVYNVLTSYDQLFKRAVGTKGKIEPFLQQLSVYDPRYIEQLRQEMKLSETLAIDLLRDGMMRRRTKAQIRKCLLPFIDPKQTLEHGRAIFREQAAKCGMNVGEIAVEDKIWPVVWDLHIRYEHVLQEQHAKMVESADVSVSMPGAHREAQS